MAQHTDLTQGSIPRSLLSYALPMALTSLLQAAYAMADLMLAGFFVGDSAISAINNASQVLMILTQIIMGITIGGGILISQYYGSRDHKSRGEANRTLFTLSLYAGLGLSFLVVFLGGPILVLLKAPALTEATLYIRICALGLLPVFGYNALAAMIRAVGNSKKPLHFIAAAVTLNVCLDALFMGAFHWGVAGAAWATVLSQCLSFLLAALYVGKESPLFQLGLGRLGIHREKLSLMLRLGFPSAVQMTLVGLSWLTMTFLINRYGVEASAASGIATKIKDVAQLFTLSMASAASTMVAQCLGAEEFERARKSVHVAMGITVAVAAVFVLVVELAAPFLVGLFHPDPLTAQYAVLNLRIEIGSLVFYASFMVYNALAMGAGHTTFALLSSIANSIVARLILAFLLDHYLGLAGIYWACFWAPLASVPLGYFYERSGVWRRSLAKAGPRQEVVEG